MLVVEEWAQWFWHFWPEILLKNGHPKKFEKRPVQPIFLEFLQGLGITLRPFQKSKQTNKQTKPGVTCGKNSLTQNKSLGPIIQCISVFLDIV